MENKTKLTIGTIITMAILMSGTTFGLDKANLSKIYSYSSPLALGTWNEYNLTLGTKDLRALVIDTYQNVFFDNNITAKHFIGDGSQLTGISTYNSTYDLYSYNHTSIVTEKNYVQIGNLSDASGTNSVAIGYNTTASEDSSVALGDKVKCSRYNTTCMTETQVKTGASYKDYAVCYAYDGTLGHCITAVNSTGGCICATNSDAPLYYGHVPVMTLIGDSEIDHTANTTYTDSGATAIDDDLNDISSDIIFVNNVNANVTGTYYNSYNVVDSKSRQALELTRIINVV